MPKKKGGILYVEETKKEFLHRTHNHIHKIITFQVVSL